MLKEKREELGMTQKEVAELIGMSEGGYRNIETRQKKASVKVLEKLSKVLNLGLYTIIQVYNIDWRK